MSESNENATQPVKIDVVQSTGVITLDRPKALNSLNPDILSPIIDALHAWRGDDAVEQVLVQSSGKHFCAGGDVRYAREQIMAGNHDGVDEFFRREYEMNYLISEFPKPYISLISGVVMGGGLGLTAHGSHFVVTPDAFGSMPEMNIGYFTDVGMSCTLQNLPKHPSQGLGTFLALTGYRLKANDMMATGLATHLVESLDGVAERVINEGVGALDTLGMEHGDAEIESIYSLVDGTFTGPWSDIREQLTGDLGELANPLLKQASPASLVASAELMDANSRNDLKKSLDNEQKLGEKIRREPDFLEGVRAVLVDKSNDADFAPEPGPERYREVLD
nr:bifunctional 3-hydroxyacyl-CoA dehydrogenase /enoyl-CoA hydratase/isomerase family protein [Streptococcus thermophilus]